MNALKDIFTTTISDRPKKMLEKSHYGYDRERGWVYVTSDFINYKSVRTYQSLFHLSETFTYFTPNSFYRNDQRLKHNLRWLNAFVIDIDIKNENKGLTLPDVLDLIERAGLQQPSLVVQTPSGGFHVYFYLKEPVRAWPNVIDKYETIQREIAFLIKGDVQAVGAERWFRIPTSSNIIYQTNTRISFNDMQDWYEINKEYPRINRGERLFIDQSMNLLEHPAIKHLFKGVSKGIRDYTCYTLALACKAVGMDIKETEQRLIEWNKLNDPQLQHMEIKRKVKSAFKPNAPKGPSAFWIRQLSGMPFSYQVISVAKPREERTNSHYTEWKGDIISFIKANGNQVSGSQRDIANQIGIPYSTFKEVIKLLIEENLLIKEVEGRGRAAVTTLKLTNIIEFRPKKKKRKTFNGPNSYTLIDTVVGGQPFMENTRMLDSYSDTS